ncbi:neuropilin-2-like [Mizuhopecten yessoensis]|uniref:Neuropilin-2 n=1 Tax=Mizuhopecten yessoensis TaxID=6573 RepID=A0A210PKZ8_MIZYE|nr:neuropilin-2-like [Mizuhopecten yessoensis]XP_021339309.1 neuropilin-2-like [Mizuhopecten yessoensis]OWF37161.1 Neuropilin-2 [Mizuhopecten yessoensis]
MKIQLWIVVYTLMHIKKGDCECIDKLINGTNDDSLTASSFYNDGTCFPRFVRINGNDLNKAWCPARASKSEYLQVEFQHMSAVTALVIQGRVQQYLTSLTMKTSQDGISWSDVTDNLGNKKIYQAANDGTTLVTRAVNENILAKFIRIHPETWFSYPSFHLEILGCPKFLGRACWIGKLGIPDKVLPVIHQTTAPNNGQCGKVCYKYKSCGSFMFDTDTTECHLYSIETFNVTAHVSTLSRKVYFVR